MVRVKEALRRLQGKGDRTSAFEQATIKRKRHDVVGHKERGQARSEMQSRGRATQLRRETLLVEERQKGRTNTFVDGRFGEHDEDMPVEDKLVQRFQRERQRQLRDSKYALDDAEDSGGLGARSAMQLTHGGQALGEMEQLSDGGWGDSDDDDDEKAQRGRGGTN